MKRNLIIIFIVLLATVAGFIYFTKDEVFLAKETSMYKAVPLSAPVFIELKALESIPFNNPILKELIEMEKEILFLNSVKKMDSLIQNTKEIQNNLLDESFILAFDFVGEGNVFPLIIKKAKSSSKQKAVMNFLTVLYPSNEFSYEVDEYSKHKITSIKTARNKNELHFCFTDGLFLASPKSLLIEQCIRQLNTQSISDNTFFSKVNRTVTSQSEISWYINHQTFPDLAALWLNNGTTKEINEFGETVRNNTNNEFNSFGKFAAWSELDIKIKENNILFNGISIADDSLNHFLSVFDGQEPIRFQADQVLPKNTSFFTSYSFSNKLLFFEKLENYFTHTDTYYKREDRIKKIEAGFRINFKNTFQELVKGEVIVATTSIPTESDKKTTLFILQTTGKSNAENQLSNLLNAYSKRKDIDPNSLKSTFEVDADTRFTIFRFPYPSFPGIWLGKPFGIAQANFAAFYENYLVFSNTEKGLHEYLYNMVLELSLTKDINYLKFKQNTVNRANINSYLNVNRIFNLNKTVFNASVSKEFKISEEHLRKFRAINWQIVCENGISFNSVNLSFNTNSEVEAQTTWQSNIGNEIKSKPQLVTNHNGTDKREVILQDTQNNLHQITNEGRVRWSKAIPEKILSKIHQVDYFKNGRLQYLFNTKNKLYLIDRNGNNVAHFPIDFRSSATNGVSVFDYDNNRKYRYFVAFEDKKVVAFNNEGKVLTGWTFGKTDFPVTMPIQHFRVNNKDYIVFKDQSHIYIQDRKGATRVKSEANFQNSNNPLILNLNGTPKIIASDKTGQVFYLYFNGKYETKKTAKFSKDHFFVANDINGNGILDFIFVDDKKLTVMDENGKKLFSEKFKNEIQNQPNLYGFSSKIKKIGIVESAANLIYLYDASGKLHEGFPLQGNCEFSIGKFLKNSDQLNLIVGSKEGNLYNYTLN